jgi:hypothetical protein
LSKVIELKAEHFQQFAKTGNGRNYSRFFIESDLRQAKSIADLSGQLVVCPKHGGCFKPRTKSKPPVWIIGFPRCGTASLCRALDLVGWDAIHNPRSWDDLAGHNAAGDVFVAAHWRDLYRAHPDAMFILNTRPFGDWLRSLRTIRGFWESSEPFDMYYRQLLYGTDNPSAAGRLLYTWRSHHESIRDTIPAGQLAEMALPFTWEQLCGFLDVPLPSVPFPHLNSGHSEHAGWRSSPNVHWLAEQRRPAPPPSRSLREGIVDQLRSIAHRAPAGWQERYRLESEALMILDTHCLTCDQFARPNEYCRARTGCHRIIDYRHSLISKHGKCPEGKW